MKLNMVTLAGIAVFAVFFFRQSSRMPWTPAHIVGITISGLALLLLVLARIQLGKAFSVRAKASTLVTSGLYSRIRNPIYVFGSLFLLGIIIWADRPWLLLWFLVLLPMQAYRSRKEAEVLEAEFGDEYREYKQKTWF
jgi:protein-S-isoprenylcysteine O-methyltransferase Ste14